MSLEVQTKKWGNSLGVVIPIWAVEKFGLKPEENIIIEINKKENALKELFGAIKFKKSTKQILQDARKEMESKWSI